MFVFSCLIAAGHWPKPSWGEGPWDDEEIPQPNHIGDPAFTYLLLEDVTKAKTILCVRKPVLTNVTTPLLSCDS